MDYEKLKIKSYKHWDVYLHENRRVKAALKTLFQPDKMNYAALSNVSEKIHVHVVPRYKEPREFGGIRFTDQCWGQNYAPYDRSFTLDERMLFKIRDALEENMLG